MEISDPVVQLKQCTVHVHKVLMPAAATLHRLGMRLVLYLDDTLVLAQTREMAREFRTALELLYRLGFIINLKSILNPTQKIEFLGFQLD